MKLLKGGVGVRYILKMGTDIYMEWKGKTKEDAEKQMTGFSIDAGDVGYLRASIGMRSENAFLRMLFSVDKYWDKQEKIPYDFKSNFEILKELGFRYLICAYTGSDFQTTEQEHLEKQMSQNKLVMQILQKSNIYSEIKMDAVEDFRFAVMWLESVFKFF